MSSNQRTKQILVILDLRFKSNREQLAGFYHIADQKSCWSVQLIADLNGTNLRTVEETVARGLDGAIIRGETDTSIVNTLQKAKVPLVAIDRDPFEPDNPAVRTFVCNDNEQIGRIAAEYFESCGLFAAYGFVRSEILPGIAWVREREHAYRKALSAKGLSNTSSTADVALRDWLSGLPRPAAVFAAFDTCAVKVIETCRQLKLRIPQDIAVLGVDDDELLCEHVRPKLSSIRPNHILQGETAARELDRLLRGKSRPKGHIVLCPPLGVTVRNSTAIIPPALRLVQSILGYLDEHAFEPIRVTDVVRAVGVSARLANLRFSHAVGHSIREELIIRRLAEAKRLLRTTDYTMRQITQRCGFKDPIVLAHLFKRRFGMSMRTWRTAFSRPANPKRKRLSP